MWSSKSLMAEIKPGAITNHNDLQNRDAVNAHSWFKNNVRVTKNLYYRKKPKMWLRDAAYTWTSRSAATTSQWIPVVWSPELGLFVATARSGAYQVMTSPDGIAWTPRSASTAGSEWRSVVWSPELGIFVAVSDTIGAIQVMTSPDGITWTSRSASEEAGWWWVTWSPELGLFVAVANYGTNQVMTSPDGITWTGRSAPEAVGWLSVVWSPELGLFVAVAYNGTNQVMTSPDGITWTSRSSSEVSSWRSVTWSPELGIFVAVAYSGTNLVMTSKSMFQKYASDVTASRALDTTYTNADSRTMTVRATVKCIVTVAGGNAYVQGKSDAADPPTTAASGIVGIEAGLLSENNSFEIVFGVAPGMNYQIESSVTNGTATLGTWSETR